MVRRRKTQCGKLLRDLRESKGFSRTQFVTHYRLRGDAYYWNEDTVRNLEEKGIVFTEAHLETLYKVGAIKEEDGWPPRFREAMKLDAQARARRKTPGVAAGASGANQASIGQQRVQGARRRQQQPGALPKQPGGGG